MSMPPLNPLLQSLLPQKADTLHDVYSNTIRMGATLNDVSIIFGATQDQGVGRIAVKDLAIARLSPRTAKSLLLNLAAAISAYEEVLGEIKMPTSTDADMAAVKASIISTYQMQMNAASNVKTMQAGGDGPINEG